MIKMESIPLVSEVIAGKKLTILEAHRPPEYHLRLLFESPNMRSPVLEEMSQDLECLIAKAARQRSDQSCPELQYDELVAEGRAKLAYVLHKEGFSKGPTRVKFFKYFAASLNNHLRSLVQKYRFTEKRTGVKPPPKEERFKADQPERIKTAEVRLDDEEINLQVADKPCEHARNQEASEIAEDYEALLDPLEVLVFRQLDKPNEEALFYATEEAMLGHKRGTPVNIRIKYEHLAMGLGKKFTVELFNDLVLSIREKITKHRSMSVTEENSKIRRNAAIAQLESIFNLQIPKTIDPIIVSRLLTICARDQYAKVVSNPEIKDLLKIVGAKVPEMVGEVLNCRGVAYHKNNRICNSCGYQNACAAESANFGLGKITISPKLLGAKLTRVPAILPSDETESGSPAPSDTAMEIMSYLDENFRKTARKGHTFYAHKEKIDQTAPGIFQVTISSGEFNLRFCSPSESMRSKLRYDSRCYYQPLDASVSEVIALIDTHAKETYVVA